MIYVASPLLMGMWVVPNFSCYKQCSVNYLVYSLHRTKGISPVY